MAHVLFGNTTAVVAIDPDQTTPFAADPTLLFDVDDGETTETPALTAEQTLFDEPLPVPSVAEPVYLIEVRAARGTPRLLAVRDVLEDAIHVAESVHPSVADVVIREVALPCDAQSFFAPAKRTWSRAPDGTWSLTP